MGSVVGTLVGAKCLHILPGAASILTIDQPKIRRSDNDDSPILGAKEIPIWIVSSS